MQKGQCQNDRTCIYSGRSTSLGGSNSVIPSDSVNFVKLVYYNIGEKVLKKSEKMYEGVYNAGADGILAAKAELNNKELWNRFNENETEMIITKTGRRIFPILKIDFSNLDPDKYYCLLLEMQLISPHRLKFTAESGWTSCGVEETPHPGVYIHPDSPSKGDHWMAQTVNFEKCKLTNSNTPSPGSLTLSSMHKYVPKIILVQTDNLQQLHWSPSKTFYFKETEFVAVTAYQNNSITALKIDHNPFAKGFRENGKSRCKKKIFEMEMKQRTSLNSPRNTDSCDSMSSPEPQPIYHPSPIPSSKSYYTIDATRPEHEQIMPICPVAVPAVKKHLQLDFVNPFENYHKQIYMYKPYLDQASFRLDIQEAKEKRDNQSVRKLTDFSIKNIIGEA
ncbi:T-box protein 2-like [Coccinella septempunctata]|uniref:T-box protein 2-like n=1 Tax=Coccinella septempunctata TaxID=41139 RepID=UPI001D05EFEF|nr:T-box protein 2-like [Coccinella septempunctata]